MGSGTGNTNGGAAPILLNRWIDVSRLSSSLHLLLLLFVHLKFISQHDAGTYNTKTVFKTVDTFIF